MQHLVQAALFICSVTKEVMNLSMKMKS
jgi:hypothetical protein